MSTSSIKFADVPMALAPPPAAHPPTPKVAIVSSLCLHYECIGFICEMFRHAAAIGIYFNGERFGWVPYFAYHAGFNNVFIGEPRRGEELQNWLWHDYDIIIKLTAGDPVIDTNRPEIYARYRDKLYGILHIAEYKMPEKYITISPFVKCDLETCYYVLPVYNGITVASRDREPMILYVGHIDRFDEDLRNFISRVNYKVVFCSPAHHRPADFNHPNMVFLGNVSTTQLIELISRCWFILGKNPRYCLMDRFNGAITLSLSYKKPMIVGRAIQEAYKMPGIVFEENYCETVDFLNSLTKHTSKPATKAKPFLMG